ncbi:uncharacterized protein LOC109534984 [Dendroctonus ponderosae]|uniref:Uncharacterized protein n=1 Tax=Dendroctonus ponderosae TaxID=77166 RepID=A0AAR5P5G7_DENPD|nr:uncharacterized protein LOC109534984 [Dendroctonus ponderosae]KAH1019709.1 hypothetical protein HUJ04_009491 [Dendroctonus ponderosae]KAH1026922.1 hypothetical protein HUJ05_000512 [Dendroctonus ponderosae]
MIDLHMVFLLFWASLAHGLPPQFNRVQFLKPATSFAARTDQFHADFQSPKFSGSSSLFSAGLSPISTDFNTWKHQQGFFQHQALDFDKSFSAHYTPDFSDGLSYPDPFLRTGIDAKRKADYLYSKELFFKDIPHIRSLLFNQHQRLDNDLAPNRLGSLRLGSPWNRFKRTGSIRESNSFFNYKNTFSI